VGKNSQSHSALGLVLAKGTLLAGVAFQILMLAGCGTGGMSAIHRTADLFPTKNPFLADSAYPIGHTNSAQVDSTPVAGPAAPGHRLTGDELAFATTGPGHLANMVASRYPDGSRVIWTNSQRDILKMDYESLRVLATYKLDDKPAFTDANAQEIVTGLKVGSPVDRMKYVGSIIGKMLPTDLASTYTMVDRDGLYWVGSTRGITAYGDAQSGDPKSAIAVKRTWKLPDDIPGSVVGINMTYDGWIVLATDRGVILTIRRDLSDYRSVWLPHSDEAPVYNARMTADHRSGYNWIRNSIAVDEQGGIYVAANGWMEKAVWNGRDLSVDPAAGAWAAPYANGTGTGTGSTPALMGFGNGDRLVVITDGDPLMRVTAFWRDGIPAGWKAPPGALSDRIAGLMPVTMGDPNRHALQSEQAVVIAGYGMVVVNNEPATTPPGLPARAKAILISMLGDDPAYTPHGMEKFAWNPQTHTMSEAWTNTTVTSPNCVPYASIGGNMVYTVGVRDGDWTLEALRLDSGALFAEYPLGGARFNTMFSGIYIDPEGRAIYGGMFGPVRINPKN
jgi:hypothetical protein